jgi:ribosomal protein L32
MTEVLSQKEINTLLDKVNGNGSDIGLETLVLSKDEIDQLLTAIGPADFVQMNSISSLADFEAFLTERKFEPDKMYGIFDKDITMCKFFESKNGETILADIERKNAEQNMGNIVIPNTNIKLINYSVCPKCKAVFSFNELMSYYKNPKQDPVFRNRGHQIREDTRVCCSECGEYFLPALIIADGTPKNEVQFLCRMQNVNAIENFFEKQDQKVLSKNKNNRVVRKLQFQNNFLIKTAKYAVFCKTCERTNRVLEQVQYLSGGLFHYYP